MQKLTNNQLKDKILTKIKALGAMTEAQIFSWFNGKTADKKEQLTAVLQALLTARLININVKPYGRKYTTIYSMGINEDSDAQ